MGAERGEQQRHRQHGGKHDQHVAVADLDRLFLAIPPARDPGLDGERDQQRAEQQRKESRSRQADPAEVEMRRLPCEDEADGRERARNGHAGAPRADDARQDGAPPSGGGRLGRFAHFFFRPSSAMTCASLASSPAISLPKSSAGR